MKYGFHMTIGKLLDDPKSRKVFQKHVPELLNHPMLGMVKGFRLENVAHYSKSIGISPEKVEEIRRELEKL